MAPDIRGLLIFAGALLLILGLLWPFLGDFGLGRLPGDVVIEGENFAFYFPITTMILLSLILSAAFWIVRTLVE